MLSVNTSPDRRFIASLDHDRPLDAMDSALLRVFSANIAVGFENVGLIERLDRLAYWDETAGLPNRHRLLKDVSEYGASGEYVALVRINSYADTLVAFGQAIAMGLLCEIAGRLASARGASPVYRYAEDILAVIVRPGEQQEALLNDLDHRQFSVAGQAIRTRIAIGSALIPYEGDVAVVCDQAYAALLLAGVAGRWGNDQVRRSDRA